MLNQESSQRLTRPSDGILVIKQDYQFLLDQDSPYYGIPFNPLSAIVMTFHNTTSPHTKLEIVVEAFDVSYKVVSGGKGDQVEKAFKTSPEMGHLMPRDVKDATWALQHQFWVRLNKTNNSCGFYVGDVSPFTKPLFEQKVNPWALPKKELERFPGGQAGQANGPGGKFQFQFNVVKISYFEGRHTTNQPSWVKWKLYENNSKPLSPVLKEPGNFYSDEEHTPIIDYPHGIQHLYAMTKNKNLRDLAFMQKSSKINESWEDVPAAIHYSLVTKQAKHYNKKPVGILNHLFRLKNHWEFKPIDIVGRKPEDILKEITEKRKAYIRFQTLAPDGEAPGSKMVLEIWPPHCCSIIHNHGEAFGVVKPLSGSIRVQNFHRLGFGNENPFAEFTYHSGSFTWMSEHSYGVHRLINSFEQTCITIQSYFNGENTSGTFSVVGKGKFAFGEEQFLGQYTPQNDWQNYIKGLTAETNEDRQFIADVIEVYGLKETGSLDLSFRKFCGVMREEYESLNTMFNKIKYEGPTLEKNVMNLFGSALERGVGNIRSQVIDQKDKQTEKTSAESKLGKDDKSSINSVKGASLREIQVFIENKLYDKAAEELKHVKDVNGVKEMIKNLRKNGKSKEVAKTAWLLFENGGDKLVYHAFGIENDETMKIGVDNKRAWMYEGQIKNGKRHGKGRMIWSNGAKYEGTFKDDMREGQGVWSHSSGGKYEGSWANDMKNGKGVFTYAETGEKYEGEYRNNDKHGQGAYYYSDGSKYVGDWKYDLKDGKGVYFMENKDRFQGYWEKDVLHGKGVYINANGQKKPKQYKQGKRV